jgi:SAM-dependent methyltransferase
MHDTAFRIGSMVMEAYADVPKASILEIGAQDVNGSLRSSAPVGADYVGIDIEEGDGVDIVSAPGASWPVDDDRFDLVMATSVFEHDTAFWRTFVQMCRKAKPGGYIYVSAPSNGKVHRYPQDYWRFYPDAGRGLEAFAEDEGLEVKLVESFIAEREEAEWNDFCAIFRRGPSSDPLPTKFLYQRVASTNALTWQTSELLNHREETEDQVLLLREREAIRRLQQEVEGERSAWKAERETLARIAAEGRIAQERANLVLGEARSQSEQVEHRIADLESNLRQRQEEISQAWTQAEAERTAKEELARQLERQKGEVEEVAQKLREADEWVFKLSGERRDAEELSKELQTRLENAHRQLAKLLEQLREREVQLGSMKDELRSAKRELSSLTAKVRENEAGNRHFQWLQRVNEVMASSTPGWHGIMPPAWRRRRQLTALRRHGLFDSNVYLERYPDVAQAGMDPLLHYILHGLPEGRQAEVNGR